MQCGVLVFICVFAFMGAGIAPALAATVPPSVSPGQVEKRFAPTPEVPETPQLQLPNPGQPEMSKEMREKLEKKQFVLKSVEIEGATVYTQDQLKFAYEDMIGKTISLLDAQGIAARITDLYHNAGYVLSQAVVPPQDVDDGVLKIRVVEGFIGDVTIHGDLTDGERERIESFADNIKAMKPIRTQDIERYLLLINDLPGATVNGLLRPSPEQFGAAELVVTLTEKKFDGSYVFDNRGSKYIGPWQHTLAAGANSLFGLYDRTQIRAFTSTPDSNQLIGGELTHEEQLDGEGTKLGLLVSHIRTAPGDSLTSLNVIGNSDLLEAKVTHPFIRLRTENLFGRVLFDYHNTITDIFNTTPFTKDRLRVARIGGTYNIVDPLRGNNLVDLQMSQGINIFGASSQGTDRSNAVGDSTFTKFNMDVSRTQPLPNNFSFLVGAIGQYSFDPLLADEQFALGGSEYARAFDPAELLGDQGLAAKGELRYTGLVDEPYFSSYQIYGFYDVGQVWIMQGGPGSNSNTMLSSTGAGARVIFTDNFSGNVELAVPLIKGTVDQTSYRHDPRIFTNLTARF